MTSHPTRASNIGFAIFCAILFSGCDNTTWSNAPERYTCTVEQMQKAQQETLFCKTNTDRYAHICYGESIMRNCKHIGTPK